MLNFDTIFNSIYLAIIIYQTIYFLVQYYVLNRVELLYYCIFLFFLLIYNIGFISSNAFEISFAKSLERFFEVIRLPLTFITNYFYILFIIHFLDLQLGKSYFLTICNYYKYINISLTILFLLLGIFNIEPWDLFHLFTAVILAYSLYILAKIGFIKKNIYAKVIWYGTSVTVIGLFLTHYFIMSGANQNYPIPSSYIPLQISQLIEVFILGYGLSLKAAEADKKLVLLLLENQKLLEVERTRMAKDLHDGLGGMLSGVKLTLGSISDKMLLPSTIFNRVIAQLDNSIEELRRVAHNMMPEALLSFGISEAIQDFCDGINESHQLKIKFKKLGLDQNIEKPTEIILYRIVQELCNNAIKHAKAKNIFIQLSIQQQGIYLTIEDDGVGFDTEKLQKGAGLRNIQSRVDYLKGKIEINSKFEVGTSIHIEIPI